MKRFLVFRYYSLDMSGGWNDLYGQSDTLDEACALLLAPGTEFNAGHVVDTQTGNMNNSICRGIVAYVDKGVLKHA